MMFRTIIHIALSLILVEGFKIDNVEPTTISQIDASLSVSWTDEGGEEGFPINLFLVPPDQEPLESEKGNVVIDKNLARSPILVRFQNIPLPGQLYLVAIDRHNKRLDGYQPMPITVTPGPPTTTASSGSQTSTSVSSQLNSLTLSTPMTTSSTGTLTSSTNETSSAGNPSTLGNASSVTFSGDPPEVSTTTPTSSFSISSNPPPASTSQKGNSSPTKISTSSPGSQESARNSKSNTGTIVGSVIGGLVFIAFLALIFLYFRRRRSRNRVHETDEFFKEKMVKQPDDTHYPFAAAAAAYSPSHRREPSREEQVPALRSYSREGSPTSSAHETTITARSGGEDEVTTRVPSRTDRQMEIEERIQQLEAQLITLYDKSRVPRSQGKNSPEEAQMGEVRGKIERLQALKNLDWALELSDERPPDMM
ncbi:hypothetical protein Moror_2463 [Moniliophthora roreri MCA 2997]|uniref:Fibronectin type-III domain-containing protein n=1 Tax=Moniliophthora roreri (strain MCA 2997) TaxID=1381753 RepID=V2Y290_MONRO|nr:hypothetical protein Moror_2463 [Moniliophthora roreri MCA 2997]